MTGKYFIKLFSIILVALLMAVIASIPTAYADDARQLKLLPGSWNATSEVEKEGVWM